MGILKRLFGGRENSSSSATSTAKLTAIVNSPSDQSIVDTKLGMVWQEWESRYPKRIAAPPEVHVTTSDNKPDVMEVSIQVTMSSDDLMQVNQVFNEIVVKHFPTA